MVYFVDFLQFVINRRDLKISKSIETKHTVAGVDHWAVTINLLNILLEQKPVL